jgi:hypothetical protein
MNATNTIPDSIRTKLQSLINGNREIMDDSFLDAVLQTDYWKEIRTAFNRNQIGTRDRFVAWIHDSAKPADLEFRGHYAYGSK